VHGLSVLIGCNIFTASLRVFDYIYTTQLKSDKKLTGMAHTSTEGSVSMANLIFLYVSFGLGLSDACPQTQPEQHALTLSGAGI